METEKKLDLTTKRFINGEPIYGEKNGLHRHDMIMDPEIDAPLNPRTLAPDHVVFISGLTPSSGTTTFGQALAEAIGASHTSMGKEVRRVLRAQSESELDVEDFARMLSSHVIDKIVLSTLPKGRVVIDGKAITTVGPNEIGDRPFTNIFTHTNIVVAAMRTLRRQGKRRKDLLLNPDLLVETVTNVIQRDESKKRLLSAELPSADLATQQKYAVQKIDWREQQALIINTSHASTDELIEALTQNETLTHEEELDTLMDQFATLYKLCMEMTIDQRIQLDPKEWEHIEENLSRIRYQIQQRFSTIIDPESLRNVRGSISSAWMNVVYALYRLIPHFYEDDKGKLYADTKSHKWTPELYKLLRAWPLLKTKLAGKTILDPFGGTGMMMIFLAARGVAEKIYLGDLCYPGGEKLNGGGKHYAPFLNIDLFDAMFDGLPGCYRPRTYEKIGGVITMDAYKAPLASNSIDYIFGDPPYGINLNDGGVDSFVEHMIDLLRVSRIGGIFLVPTKWLCKIDELLQKQTGEARFRLSQLTTDLSHGESNHPTCMILIEKMNQRANS